MLFPVGLMGDQAILINLLYSRIGLPTRPSLCPLESEFKHCPRRKRTFCRPSLACGIGDERTCAPPLLDGAVEDLPMPMETSDDKVKS